MRERALKRVNAQCNCACAWYIKMSFAQVSISVCLVFGVDDKKMSSERLRSLKEDAKRIVSTNRS